MTNDKQSEISRTVRATPNLVSADYAILGKVSLKTFDDFLAERSDLQQLVLIDRDKPLPAWATALDGQPTPSLRFGYATLTKPTTALIVLEKPPEIGVAKFDTVNGDAYEIDARLCNARTQKQKQDLIKDKTSIEKERSHVVARFADKIDHSIELIEGQKATIAAKDITIASKVDEIVTLKELVQMLRSENQALRAPRRAA
jgi:hypothetical protein